MASLLLEIGCEELPASFCGWAVQQLEETWLPRFGEGAVFVTPRRLAFLVKDFQETRGFEEKRGPSLRVAFDEEGKPTAAAEGFARNLGLEVSDLIQRDDHVWGQTQPPDLGDRLWQVVAALGAGKTMRWLPRIEGRDPLVFIRPVRWTCAKLGTEAVDLHRSQIVPSVSHTFGHRFSHGRVDFDDAADYAATLRAADVEPDSSERRKQIVEGLDALGGWADPNGVLAEVVYLVEKPLVVGGRFDERYLQLPSRVVETTIQHHIRAFPLGENRFAFVANGGDPDTVRAGVENVVEGRLEDASFTFERDVTVGIDELAERLGAITFFQGAGSFADKAERLAKLVEALGGGEAALEAARLAKADQASELVREFPELEGHIGAEYARLAGYPEAVSAAIDEQYLPDSADAPLPGTETGRVLSAADKIDTLNVSFGLGHRPTGSRDPYGLRRAAIGLCRLATEGNLSIPREGMEPEVAEFVEERFEGLLDAPVEYVRAARHASVRDLGGVARLAQALAELPDERFDPIHTAYTRATRLAEKEEGAADQLDPALLVEEAEAEVAGALERVDPQIAAALDVGDFGAAVEAAAELGPLLDRFFEDVLVLAEDRAVRANRLRLLLNVKDTLGRLGELSQIPR